MTEGVLSRGIAQLVSFAVARRLAVIALCAILGLGAAVYSVLAFDIRTDLDSLIAADLPWRLDASALEQAFPDQGDDITIVLDADTPERAEQAAAALTAALTPRHDFYQSVQRANGGPFFDREGLLFSTTEEVRQYTSDLIQMQPLLGPIAADPSFRGLNSVLQTTLSDPAETPAHLHALARPIARMDQALSAVESGDSASLSWRNLLSADAPNPVDWRQFIEIIPKVDYTDMDSGARAVAAIRNAARRLGLSASSGVHMRITGSVPIASEELATLSETTGPIAFIMLGCVVFILFAGVRSWRAIAAIFATVLVGGALTSAIGLFLLHRFNIVSIAFFPLFVGLSIDFAIQFVVRAGAERNGDLRHALVATGKVIGPMLVIVALAIAAAFFAFLPTHYRGIAELGLIAGIGMIIALVLSLTFLPALLSSFNAPEASAETSIRAFAHGDSMITRWRIVILAVVALGAVASIVALPHLTFNFDPMRLRSDKTESVSTYLELTRSSDTTPTTLNILSPSLNAAQLTAARIAKLPEVADASTLADAIPDHQDEKLALIADAALLLDPTINPFFVAPAPSDAERIASLHAAAARLRAAAPLAQLEADADVAASLANRLDRIASGAPELRDAAQQALLGGLPTALSQISASLTAEPITLASIPPEIRRQWITSNGAARIEVSPLHPLRTLDQTTRFVDAVRAIAPTANGDAVTIVEVGRTIRTAFLQAGIFSAIAITALLLVALRSVYWTALAVAPILLSGVLTFATCVVFGLDINLENMIALPLLLAVGVAFNIYFVIASRGGERQLLGSSLARGVFFSALTTGTAFATLGLSAHPGTSSMGLLLLISLSWTLAATLIVLPALLDLAAPRTTEATT